VGLTREGYNGWVLLDIEIIFREPREVQNQISERPREARHRERQRGRERYREE
jgi:hypothetical protein